MIEDMRRSCANCCSYSDGECMNGIIGDITPAGRCDDHETEVEYQRDVDALARFRVSIGLQSKMQ